MDEELIEIGKALPDTGWNPLVDTACGTVESILAPLTETTGGVGRLIRAKFDRFVDAEKVLAAEALREAHAKAKRASHPRMRPRPNVLLQVLEHSASETDPHLRELWSNLLAGEFVDNRSHPEFSRILSRLSAGDAQLLAEIAETSGTLSLKAVARALAQSLSAISEMVAVLSKEEATFAHAHLHRLDLIVQNSGSWHLSVTGKAFLRAVSNPADVEEAR